MSAFLHCRVKGSGQHPKDQLQQFLYRNTVDRTSIAGSFTAGLSLTVAGHRLCIPALDTQERPILDLYLVTQNEETLLP